MNNNITIKFVIGIVLAISGLLATPVNAAPVSYWSDNGFTQITDDDGVASGGFVDPGWGGQAFDAEYLYYKLDGSTLYIGLQSGFDLIDGVQEYLNKDYWAGDLALSFDGDVNLGPADPSAMADSYEFGIDFGLFTADYNSGKVDAVTSTTDGLGSGIDRAGVYSVNAGQWNTNMVDNFENDSSPLAMNQLWDGTGADPYLTALTLNEAGQEGDSYYRAIAFDLTQLGLADLNNLTMDIHWTMSCGNDSINGSQSISVPEPGSLVLLATGLLGFIGGRKVCKKL